MNLEPRNPLFALLEEGQDLGLKNGVVEMMYFSFSNHTPIRLAQLQVPGSPGDNILPGAQLAKGLLP